jgi:acylphosphatase
MEETLPKEIEVGQAACLIIIKGRVCAAGMRHYAFEKAKHFGVHGYLNYQNGGCELHILAEAENEDLFNYISWIKDFCKSNHLIAELLQAEYQGFNSLVIAIPGKSSDALLLNQTIQHEAELDCNESETQVSNPGSGVILTFRQRLIQDYALIINKLKNVSLW